MRYILIHIPTSLYAVDRYGHMLSFKDGGGAAAYLKRFGDRYTIRESDIQFHGWGNCVDRQYEFCIAGTKDLYGIWNNETHNWVQQLGTILTFFDVEAAASSPFYAKDNWMHEIKKL